MEQKSGHSELQGLQDQGLRLAQHTGVLPWGWPFKDKGTCVQAGPGGGEAEQDKSGHLPGHSRDRPELGDLKTPGPEASLHLCVTVVRSTGLCKPPLMTACSPELGTEAGLPRRKGACCVRCPFIYKRGSRVSGRKELAPGHRAAAKNDLF